MDQHYIKFIYKRDEEDYYIEAIVMKITIHQTL